jgi:hypothetical protein
MAAEGNGDGGQALVARGEEKAGEGREERPLCSPGLEGVVDGVGDAGNEEDGANARWPVAEEVLVVHGLGGGGHTGSRK